MVEGPLRKMLTGLDDRVHYALVVGEAHVPIDDRVGGPFTLHASGRKTCVICGRSVSKFFGQGFCFPCSRDAPEASECIVRPELCRAHLGEGRDPEWERVHHDQEHVVYLSYTGGIKVGVTRSTQVPVRWIDQGAVAAVVIARTPYRRLAGLIEVELKKHFADRTNWRAMLRPVMPDIGALLDARSQAVTALAHELGAYVLADEDPWRIDYPVDHFPPKVASVSLDKEPTITGTLAAIKGQYLVWADGRVLNVRNHAGYHVEVDVPRNFS
ncbi:MAG: DUF2797 domain-containing protein [Flavobacteriales bacterium]|nr:DUF2797 domain-containing protein [Flavobacteriales bacterium]